MQSHPTGKSSYIRADRAALRQAKEFKASGIYVQNEPGGGCTGIPGGEFEGNT